ncbi:endochitinase A-like isoform X1 [Asterias rubens]|uniref:endochitinase A-like isoform X1 n=1 Tax=Asterias rubens TaxID=7604 RepID=UPI00145525B2|nr:endochitinase A-like isoform X1 [Asterias rubens]
MATPQAWWANMPLPPGWDAKYDQGAKKYFFVHHSTKSTQWNDPRKQYYESQQRAGFAPAPQHAPRMAQHSPRMPQHSPRMPQPFQRMPPQAVRQAIPMQPIVKPKCKTCNRIEVPSNNQECQGCQLKARQREAELVRAREAEEAQRKKHENQQRIQKEQERRRVQSAARARTPMQMNVQETAFGEETVEQREYTAAEKREMINNLNDAFPEISKTVVEMVLETSTWDANKATSVLATMSPRKPMAPKPKATTSSAAASSSISPTQPSDAVKKRMLTQLQSMHTSASSTLVEMALSTAKYNVAKASQLLRMSLDPPGGQKTAPAKVVKPATTSHGTTSVVTTTRTVVQQPKRSAPELFSSLTTPVVSTTPRSPTTPVSSTSTARASTVTIATRAPSPSRQPRQAKGRATQRTKESPKKAPYVSKSTIAQGPDASLLSGPDKDILLTAYISENRSDKSLVHGPLKENVAGPSHPNGRDYSLASGPDDCICNGPQMSLAKGSLFTPNRQL